LLWQGTGRRSNALAISRDNVRFDRNREYHPKIYKGDARKLTRISDDSIDLICTHPPYSNIIKYSDDIKNDLSHLDIPEFLLSMQSVAAEAYRVLKPNK